LYDAANSARNATNGYPWGSLYDASGAAHAATNGYPWGSLYDAAGLATAATNGYPWGSLYDSANAAHNATNGYPWGSLYDSSGAATAATNSYPWSPLYVPSSPILTNQVRETNVVVDTLTLSPTSNATNYTLPLVPGPGPGTATINGANTNAFITLTGTNNADWERTLFVNNYTSSVNCNLTFNFTFSTNQNFSATVSNGWAGYFNFHNPDSTGTNVSVSDSGRYHH
jgi:hypothetical protein